MQENPDCTLSSSMLQYKNYNAVIGSYGLCGRNCEVPTMENQKKRIFSGIQPSGDLTLRTHISLHVWLPHLWFFHPCLLSALQAANSWSVSLLKPRLEPSGSDDQQSASQYFQSHRGLCTVLGMVGGGKKSQQLCRPPRGGFFLSFSPLCPITSHLHSRTASMYK